MPKMHIDRSITIDAPVQKVFKILNDFHHWPIWSPWLVCEPDSTLSIREDGKYYEWDGKRVGAGNMSIISETPDRKVDLDLTFLKPWKSTAKVQFICKAEGQKTKVNWTMDSSMPFFMFFMKKMMEAFVAADYDRGLNMLKEYAETGSVSSKLDFRGETDFPGCEYIGIKTTTTIEQNGVQMESDYTKLWSYFTDHKIEPAGNALSIYHKFDFVKSIVQYTACIPVSRIPADLPSEFIIGEIPATKIYTLRHIGPYLHLGNAWTTMHMMLRNKEFKAKKGIHPFESYINMPGEVPDQDLITDIHFAIK
ncbi:MAG: SRPBCC family protein [Saprospiraceae bacterium]|nr:SRPBCC family protein [Saprospiraceae bacterium]